MIPLSDLGAVVMIATACALAVAAFGALGLRAVRSRSLAISLVLVVLVAIGAVAAGAVGTASRMFLSAHDLRVLFVVLGVSGAVGVLSALALGRAVVRGSDALGLSARGLGEPDYRPVSTPLSAELARLDARLGEASQRLAESRAREHALERSRRELVAWVSHDLRSPLAGILAMAEALEDGVVVDDDTVDRYHAGIRTEAQRLSAMVDDLFELSRINADALRLTLQDISLADVVSDAIASASPLAEARGVRLLTDAATPLPPIAGSLPELGRVLRNLLTNAIRHTPADGVVNVRLTSHEGAVQVEVADACGGIPDEDLPRVFDVAFRGTAARTPGEGGGGLGLAIARGLVRAHRGSISIANSGPGCRVLVSLPAVASASPPSPPGPARGSRRSAPPPSHRS
jgi:signal transduction histidine kinase